MSALIRPLYRGLIVLALPFAAAYFVLRALRGHRGELAGLAQRFGFGSHRDPTSGTRAIWVHAVSVGEVQAGAALVRALQTRYPDRPITLTTTTGTGATRARALFGETIDIRFLPFDSTGCVRRFLDRVQPELAIVLEKEWWPTLFGSCLARGVPVVMASATMSPRAVRRYRRVAALFGETRERGITVAAQSAADAVRFVEVGFPAARVSVIGNLKFDLELPTTVVEDGRALRERYGWQDHRVLVGGSTYAAEEQALLEAQRRARAQGIPLALVLAPRQPTRFAAVAAWLQSEGVAFAQRSQASASRSVDVVLLDTLGELTAAYAAADLAFVGGSLVTQIGGHNLIEPAALAVATITGPHGYNAPDITSALAAEGGLTVVSDANALTLAVGQLAVDSAERTRRGRLGRAFVERNRGTLARLLALLETVRAEAALRSSPTSR